MQTWCKVLHLQIKSFLNEAWCWRWNTLPPSHPRAERVPGGIQADLAEAPQRVLRILDEKNKAAKFTRRSSQRQENEDEKNTIHNTNRSWCIGWVRILATTGLQSRSNLTFLNIFVDKQTDLPAKLPMSSWQLRWAAELPCVTASWLPHKHKLGWQCGTQRLNCSIWASFVDCN